MSGPVVVDGGGDSCPQLECGGVRIWGAYGDDGDEGVVDVVPE